MPSDKTYNALYKAFLAMFEEMERQGKMHTFPWFFKNAVRQERSDVVSD